MYEILCILAQRYFIAAVHRIATAIFAAVNRACLYMYMYEEAAKVPLHQLVDTYCTFTSSPQSPIPEINLLFSVMASDELPDKSYYDRSSWRLRETEEQNLANIVIVAIGDYWTSLARIG
jgi:hypothetical protein